MSSLIKLNNIAKVLLKNPATSYIAVRNHWNKDYKPGPYPKTFEERAAAAKKYGLAVDEYDVYPDDGMGCGDYPKLPLQPAEFKDPYYPYDFPELKRNFNEPLHLHFDMIGEDRCDDGSKLRYTPMAKLLTFLGVMGGLWTVYVLLEQMKTYRPALPKQYPKAGVTHYTFEQN